jgi:alkanesulfonate monooxygenase SsuD/methylene tetrahydromethanopterin reductase-like flavin-dependent oxidoreductase (luciferase family)
MMQSGPRRNADPINARKLFLASSEQLDDADRTGDWFDFLVRRDHVHVGTPEYVTERLKRFQTELGCEHFVLHWAVPLVTYEQYKSSLTLFSEKVMTQFL